MAEVAYREVYVMNAVCARRRLIQMYRETGSIRATARRWQAARQPSSARTDETIWLAVMVDWFAPLMYNDHYQGWANP